MSRIGNAPITVPQGVEVSLNGNTITVKGSKGELSQEMDACVQVKLEEGVLNFSRISNDKEHRSKHGLYRSLVNNMIHGVSQGYKTEQELVGVGYRAQATGQKLELTLGFSHNVLFVIPDEVSITTLSERGSNPKIILESFDKQLIGQVAAKIRSFRKPEPFKGKGIRFIGEQVRRKAGKAASK